MMVINYGISNGSSNIDIDAIIDIDIAIYISSIGI